MELEKWFKLKKYPHIGLPITIKDYNWVNDYVTNPSKVKKHSFLPLIHKEITKRKFRADKDIVSYNPSGKRKRIKSDPKTRHIFYSSHLDSIVLSYYNSILSENYEKFIKTKLYNNSIVAYRKIPITKGSDKNKCNIDFAKTTFEFIKKNNQDNLTVVVADITSFFDKLDHSILKRQWTKVLPECSTLPNDHYNIFKALTRIKYVEGKQLFKSYDKTMIVEKGIPNLANKKENKRIKINSTKYFKEKNAIAYCTKKEFLKNNLNLVISKGNSIGIPQGSPISATLANIYMINFDNEIFNKISSIGGFYQRYSDDIIIVFKREYENEIIRFIRDRIENLVKLEISPTKTKIYHFESVKGKIAGFEIDEITKKPNYNKTLEYLGFLFDGERVLVKTSGFSKFYRSMKGSMKKSASLAKNSKNPDNHIFKSRLFKRFTHRGAKRKLVYQPSIDDKTKYEITKKFYWGNYISYINKANHTMYPLNGNKNLIKRQSRKLWKKFNTLLKFNIDKISKKTI